MKRYLIGIILAFFLFLIPENLRASDCMVSNYAKGKQLAQMYQLPLVLLFTGSDWSEASHSLIRDCHHLTRDCVIVILDFPELSRQPLWMLEQNHRLKKHFDIRQFPTLILLDPYGREVSRFGYPMQSSKHLLTLVKEHWRRYLLLTQLYHRLEKQFEEKKLVLCYQEAIELGCHYLKDHIMTLARDQKRCPLVLLEYYAYLLHMGKKQTIEAKTLRAHIISKSAQIDDISLRLALLDWQQDGDIKPLKKWAANIFIGTTRWSIEWMIAQILFNQNRLPEALFFQARTRKELRYRPAQKISCRLL